MNKVTRVKNTNYTTISNVFLRDKELSLKAKGLLAIILSLPDDWDFSIKGICSTLKEGTTAIYSAIDELKSRGYCNVVTVRNEKGMIVGNDYTFLENPNMENLNVDNQAQINNSISNTKDTNIQENKENKDNNKKELKEKFEECWLAYNRKGAKGKAFDQWKKLSSDERANVLPHIKAYVGSRERQYQKDFERYLRDRTFLDVVSKGNSIVYDPTKFDSNIYSPQGRSIWFNEDTKSYWSDDNFYYGTISDGYDDGNRPNGATLTLNNARGNIVWNANIKQWEKKINVRNR